MPSFSFRNVSASAVLDGYQRGVADWSLTLDEIIFLAIFAHPVRMMPLRYGVDFKISRELFGRDSFGIVGETMHFEQPYLTAEDGDIITVPIITDKYQRHPRQLQGVARCFTPTGALRDQRLKISLSSAHAVWPTTSRRRRGETSTNRQQVSIRGHFLASAPRG